MSKNPNISKRSFRSLSEDPSPTKIPSFSRGKPSKPSKNPDFRQYFHSFPEHLLDKILSFLPKKAYFDLKLVNKDFYQVVSRLFTTFDFKYKDTIPIETLQKLIKNGGKPRRLRFGRLNFVNSELFLRKIMEFLRLQHLETLDFRGFAQLNDEILLKCLEKTDFNLISELWLPYSSKITDFSLGFVEKKLRNLRFFALTSDFCCEENGNFRQETLKSIFSSNPSLIEFRVEVLNHVFLQDLQKTELILKNLQYLEVKNLQLEDIGQLKLFETLTKMCPNLVKLVFREIFIRNRIIERDCEEVLQVFEKSLRNLKNLRILKVGHFVSQKLLGVISENCESLEGLKVVSENLSEEDLREFFFNSENITRVYGSIGPEYEQILFERRRIFVLI